MADPQDITASDFRGRVYAVQLRDAQDGDVLADLDLREVLAGEVEMVDDAGRTWTVEGAAAVVPYGPPWVDISTRITHASWGYGRDDELGPFPPGEAALTLSNDDRAFDPEHTSGPYHGRLLPRTPFRIRMPNPDAALELVGDAVEGGRARTPTSSLTPTPTSGDVDVAIEVTRDWGLVNGAGEVLAARYRTTLATERSWWWALGADGRLRLRWSASGVFDPALIVTSTTPVPIAAAQRGRLAVRVTLETDTGFDQHEVRFYAGPSVDGPWTPLGQPVTVDGTTQVHNATSADLTVGAAHAGGVGIADYVTMTGRVHALRWRDGIGGALLATPDFTAQTPGALGFTDAAGRTWTITPGAAGSTAALISDPEPADLFYGYVEDGFEQDFQPPAKGQALVRLVDLGGILHGTPLPTHAYEGEVLTDTPAAYWPMDEADGAAMGDRSGNERNGAYESGIVGDDDPLVAGSQHSFRALLVGGTRGRYLGEALPAGPPMTVEAWIRTTRSTRVKTIVGIQPDYSGGLRWYLGIGSAANTTFTSPNGELLFVSAEAGIFVHRARGHVRVDDGRVHHVAAVITAAGDLTLYVDGVAQEQTVMAGGDIAPWPDGRLWTVGDLANPAGDFGLDGNVGQVTVYDRALPASRITAHYAAGSAAFEGEFTGERLRRMLRTSGIGQEWWDIAPGDTTVGRALYGNASVGEHADKVAESEQGVLFIDHRRGGRLTFRGRYDRHLNARSASVQYAFSDADTPAALHYERSGLEITPNGIDGIVNVAEVRWQAGTEVVRDEASVAAYGAQSRTLETDSPSPQVARSAGQWMVHRNAAPQARVRAFALAPAADSRVLPAALDTRISDRISVQRHPLAVGNPITSGLFIEGVAHEVEGAHWGTAVRTSSADGIGEVWVWDSEGGEEDEWDTTTIWG